MDESCKCQPRIFVSQIDAVEVTVINLLNTGAGAGLAEVREPAILESNHRTDGYGEIGSSVLRRQGMDALGADLADSLADPGDGALYAFCQPFLQGRLLGIRDVSKSHSAGIRSRPDNGAGNVEDVFGAWKRESYIQFVAGTERNAGNEALSTGPQFDAALAHIDNGCLSKRLSAGAHGGQHDDGLAVMFAAAGYGSGIGGTQAALDLDRRCRFVNQQVHAGGKGLL